MTIILNKTEDAFTESLLKQVNLDPKDFLPSNNKNIKIVDYELRQYAIVRIFDHELKLITERKSDEGCKVQHTIVDGTELISSPEAQADSLQHAAAIEMIYRDLKLAQTQQLKQQEDDVKKAQALLESQKKQEAAQVISAYSSSKGQKDDKKKIKKLESRRKHVMTKRAKDVGKL